MYNRMTPYKLERNTISGKALYTYADKQNGVVYIAGDKAYQRYRQLADISATAKVDFVTKDGIVYRDSRCRRDIGARAADERKASADV